MLRHGQDRFGDQQRQAGRMEALGQLAKSVEDFWFSIVKLPPNGKA
ncbi:MAG: hypothetical protein HY900_08940 [Deltaproteobacteria bacterium]|nr:hypothetical protein [Deltaproteobacteria bacterium]